MSMTRALLVSKSFAAISALVLSMSITSCKKNDAAAGDDIQESAQQIGDVMASIDEAGGSDGSLGMMMKSQHRTFARHGIESPTDLPFASIILPKAQALSCGAWTYGSCTSNSIVRNFSGCTAGGLTFTGTVNLTWTGTGANLCRMMGAGATVTRDPSFTITGRRGGTLTVTKSGSVGQRVTYDGSSFAFSNDGIQRTLTVDSTTLFDFTTETTTDITITGSSRASRTMNGGGLKVTDNLTGVACTFTPVNVTWTSSCNCATSGAWSGTCTDGKTSTLTITGCGTATFELGSASESLEFDRCYSI